MLNAGPSTSTLRWLLVIASALAFFYNLHALPLFDLDEGAFSEATREMFARGDFISPYLNGMPRYDKPILIYWLQATSVAALGLNEFALRLPSALAACAWTGVVYWVMRGVRDERTALWTALMMVTSLEVPVMGKAATADALLNLWITATMLLAFRHYARRRTGDLYLTYACMGLGFLTKGPIAVLIPLAVTCVFYLSLGRGRDWLRAVTHPGGLALFAAIAAPWYVAQYHREGTAFLQGFFLKHNLGRYADAMETHRGGIGYYVPVVLLGVLPYTTLILGAGARLKESWSDPLARYALLWFGLVFVFFSAGGTKLPHYIVYGYPALFILLALRVPDAKASFWLALPAALWFALMLFLPELIALALPRLDPWSQTLLEHYRDYFGAGYRWYFAACLALAVYFMAERRVHAQWKLPALGLALVLGVSQYLLPAVAGLQQTPIKEAALLAHAYPGPLVMYRINTPSFDVYARRLSERRAPRPGDLVLTKSLYLEELGPAERWYLRNGIALVRLR